MPLSEHEQRLLEQMEQQLLSDDPRFASTMRGPRTLPAARRRLVLGILGVLVGLAMLVLTLFVPHQAIWLGVAAFAVMFAGVLYAMSASSVRGHGPQGVVGPDGRTVAAPAGGRPRTQGGARGPARGQGGSRARRPVPGSGRAGRRGGHRGTFMQRLEQRWDRRRDERWT